MSIWPAVRARIDRLVAAALDHGDGLPDIDDELAASGAPA